MAEPLVTGKGSISLLVVLLNIYKTSGKKDSLLFDHRIQHKKAVVSGQLGNARDGGDTE